MERKRVNFIGGLIFASIFAYSFFKYNSDIKALKSKMLFSKGIVKKTKIGKSNYFIIYDFNYLTKSYSEHKSIFGIVSFSDANKFLVGKSFPLIISEEDPENNDLLIFKEDFEKYNLVYPDSLKWVCDSLKLKDCN